MNTSNKARLTELSIPQSSNNPPVSNQVIWVIMGVCGCGKTEVGQRLANELDIPFIEGDRFHPQANIDKMRAGIPLDDTDRHSWLLSLQKQLSSIPSGVLSCSALKRSYRDILRENNPNLIFVHLYGDEALLTSRLNSRVGHFMPISLLRSQLADLQALQDDERGFSLDINPTPNELVQSILRHFVAPNSLNKSSVER